MKTLPLTPILSVIVGVVILLFPSILNYAVALYFIATGVLELSNKR